MKNTIILIFTLFVKLTFAQTTHNLGDFDKVKVFDSLNVKLIPSSKNKVVIIGNRENEVEIVTKNDELKIRMPFPKLLSGNDISIVLFFKNIEAIEASEGSFVSCDSTFKQTSINLNSKSGGVINIDLDVANANIRAVSGGIIELTGKATNQNVSINSGGTVKASDLHTSQTLVTVSAGGKAEVFADDLVKATVKAGGNIYIYGKPKQINKETVMGGSITEKK